MFPQVVLIAMLALMGMIVPYKYGKTGKNSSMTNADLALVCSNLNLVLVTYFGSNTDSLRYSEAVTCMMNKFITPTI